MSLESITQKLTNMAIEYGPKLLLALVVLWLGFKLANACAKMLQNLLLKKKFDESLTPFLCSLLKSILKVMVVISVASMLGVQTTSFVAMLGAMSLAVGMALQGSLANFAGGVMILVFKPFQVGDYLEAQDVQGTVKEIQIFNTIMTSLDGKKIIVPNGVLSNGKMINYSAEENRRVEFTFGVGYDDDLDHVSKVINQVIESYPKALKDPKPTIAVTEHADNSVNFTVHVWCKNEDYWGTYFYYPGEMKKAFDREKISIPYPQRDVHMITSAVK